MLFIRSAENLTPNQRHSVATIGNFDGIHLGHQQLLQQVVAVARRQQVPASVILFEPQPAEFFATADPPARLLRLRDKITLLAAAGIDQIICLRFDQRLANLSAAEFIQKILVDQLAISQLIIGDDFRFGKNREGDIHLLEQATFPVTRSATFNLAGQRVSSSRIRALLAIGDFTQANQLLGYPYFISGHIAHGDKRGRILGFATANLFLQRRKIAFTGVYAVRIYGLDQVRYGVANLGTRPTVNGLRTLLEVHLFDFNEIIYGKFIRVEFLKKIRDEQKFNSLDELVAQIKQDVLAAKTITK